MAKAKKKSEKSKVARSLGVRQPSGGQRKLDRFRALKAAGRGASARKVAKAAGSKATGQALKKVGQRLLRTLRQRGELMEALADRNFDVGKYADHLKSRLYAMETETAVHKGKFIYSEELINWKTRTAAAREYLLATGILNLPVEPGEADEAELGGTSDRAMAGVADAMAELQRLAAEKGA